MPEPDGALLASLPLSQAAMASRDDIRAAYLVSPRRLRVGLPLDHEWSVGPFDGPHSLGILADLAALRLVAVQSASAPLGIPN